VQAAKRVLDESCGPNMNTWQVARHPVGYYNLQYSNRETMMPEKDTSKSPSEVPSVHETAPTVGEKTFFIKTRIFAGQANVDQPTKTYEDFAWLAKEEIEAKVHPRYWTRVKNMLVEQ
jgi:large subunit ribosomal protein L46